MKKSIAIIGAGPGIGQAVAHKFGHEGYEVVLLARTAPALHELVAELHAAGIRASALGPMAASPTSCKRSWAASTDCKCSSTMRPSSAAPLF